MSRSGAGSPPPLPSGWPDDTVLEKLANELFASPPGQAFVPAPLHHDTGLPVPTSRPTPGMASGPPPGSTLAPTPALTPTPASTPTPTRVPTAAPHPADAEPPVARMTLQDADPIAVDLPGTSFLGELHLAIDAPGTFEPAPPQRSLQGSVAPEFYFLEYAGGVLGTSRHVGLGHDTPAPLDVERIRQDFPILQERINGRPLVWLDNAATTQKPRAVTDRLVHFYHHENSNIHRAAHELAARATDAYEAGRETARAFLEARSSDEIVFVRGATEAINLVAGSWGRAHIGRGDEIVITWLEHHANIVPWQRLAQETQARLRVVPVDDDGQVIVEEYARLLNERTKLVAVTHVSNALGTITPVERLVAMGHAAGARVLVDGAQAVSHMPVDVQRLDADWYVFSGHKVFAPTGIGVLYGKASVLDEMPPWQSGGNMIEDVTFEHISYQDAPARFEAGTGNIADVAGMAAALEYLMRLGLDAVSRHEHQLLAYATRWLTDIPGLRLIGTAADKAGVLSFVIEGCPTSAIGEALNRDGIAVRAGHHCAQPILRRFGVESTVRPSLALYNTTSDIDRLVEALRRYVARRPASSGGVSV